MTLKRRRSPPLFLSTRRFTSTESVNSQTRHSSELRTERTADPPALRFTVSHATCAVGNWEWGLTNDEEDPVHAHYQVSDSDLFKSTGSASDERNEMKRDERQSWSRGSCTGEWRGTNHGVLFSVGVACAVLMDDGSKVICDQSSNTRPTSESVNMIEP